MIDKYMYILPISFYIHLNFNDFYYRKVIPNRNGQQQQKKPIRQIDARNKIIQKNRMKYRDAREKLHQMSRKTDARLKIMKMQKRVMPMVIGEDLGRQPTRKPVVRHERPARRTGPLRTSSLRPPSNTAVRFGNTMDVDEPSIYSLRRTVKNELSLPVHSSIPPFPNFGRSARKSPPPFSRSIPIVPSDPFDCYEVPVRRPMDVSEPVNIQRKIYNIESDDIHRKGILRPPSSSHMNPILARRYVPDENSSLSYEMRSRLENAPDPNESSGIFAREPQQIQQQPSLSGYRIVVSNLHTSVSQGDIKELFEDIGELMEARLVRPGVAEVIFRTREDAEEAVDTYHNRHLDGQPMKCLLVQPRASSKPTAPALKPQSNISSSSLRTSSSAVSKSSSKTPLEIDIDALHKVLFRRN